MRIHRNRRGGYVGQAWLVLMLAVVFGGALAGVHLALQPKIDENKRNETYGKVPDLVRVPAGEGEYLAADPSKTETWVSGDGKIALKGIGAGGEHVGWLIKGSGQGFADKIELLIGLDADAGTITGMYVLDQKETPGLGNNITKDEWREQYSGKSTAQPLEVVKGGAESPQEINAVTGATISSETVTNIVNKAVAEFRANMNKLTKKD